MKKLAKMLKEYVERNPLNYGEAESALDVLFWHYMEYGSLGSEKIRDQFDTLRKLVSFPPKEYDQVFEVVSDLCLEHGRLAFREGMRFGMLLMCEIEICGEDRNSYSKTDHDATFMRSRKTT